MTRKNDPQIFEDVFEALDLPDAQDMRTRVGLAAIVTKHIRDRGWTQKEAAEHVGFSQGDISRLMNGNVRGLSEGRLEAVLVLMDLVVRITVSAPLRGETPGILVEMGL